MRFGKFGVVKFVKTTPIQVSFALLVFLISFVAHVGAFTYYFFSIREDVWKWLAGSTGMVDDWWMRATVLSSSFLPIAAVLGPTILYIGIGLMKDIDCLRIQLSCFSIQECKCYCCSINHQDPTTGLRVPCDREVIFTTLQEWYGNTDGHWLVISKIVFLLFQFKRYYLASRLFNRSYNQV